MAAQTPVNNFMVPATGTPNSVPVQGPFSATPLVIDFRENGLDGSPFVPQGLFADNTTGSAPLVIAIQGMNWSVVVPTGSQLGCQYPAPIGQIVSITGNNAGGSIVFCDFPVLPFNNAAGGAGGGPVTIADGADVTLGARADAPAANDTGSFSLIAFTKRMLSKMPVLGTAVMAASTPVTLATDDTQIGTKVTAIPALGAGGAGLIGWLSTIVGKLATLGTNTMVNSSPVTIATNDTQFAALLAKFPVNGFPAGAVPVAAASANSPNAAINLSLPAAVGKTTYITQLVVSGGGATAAGLAGATLSNTLGGSVPINFSVPAGAGLAINPIVVNFNPPLCANAANVAINLLVTAYGAGNVASSAAIAGYQL